jgi:mono/diheme cytochrome c family protein
VNVPRWIWYTALVLVSLSWIPLVLIARARVTTTPTPRIHIIQDMDNQPKFKPQQANPMFADTRAMRPPVPGTVARGTLVGDPRLETGLTDPANPESWVEVMPVEVTPELMKRGREQYDVFCSPCHGLGGVGNGAVSVRAEALQEGTWTPPSSFHTELVRSRQVGHLYNTITNGIRNMPAYGTMIDRSDRWAIVAYVRALQRSQYATVDDVPAELRPSLR